jgi:hypothetical protein
MRKFSLSLLSVLVLLLIALGLIQVARGQGLGEQVVAREVQGTNVREIVGAEQADTSQQPDISFIDSPTVSCYQPDSTQDACYLNWYYMAVDANPNYVTAMTVTVSSPTNIVARMNGFFQTSMYAPYDMFGNGFRVACGALGAGGNPQLGNAYSWAIQALDSANSKSANSGTAYCPAYIP